MEGSQQDEFPFTEYATRLGKVFDKLDGRVKFSAKNAYRHLRGAWLLRNLDQGMAAFRAITAEEEAATALIFALKHRKYPNAERLDHHRHDHKVAVFALIQVVSKILSRQEYKPEVHLVDGEDQPKFRLQFDINKLAGVSDVEPIYGESVHPLDFNLANSRGDKILTEEFLEFAGERGFEKTIHFIKAEANARNRILYASEVGVPSVKISDEFILHRKDRVVTLLTITVMIEQTDEFQGFVIQCLNTLVGTLTKLDDSKLSDQFDVDPSPERPRVQIVRAPEISAIDVIKDGERKTAHFQYSTSMTFRVSWPDVWTV